MKFKTIVFTKLVLEISVRQSTHLLAIYCTLGSILCKLKICMCPKEIQKCVPGCGTSLVIPVYQFIETPEIFGGWQYSCTVIIFY